MKRACVTWSKVIAMPSSSAGPSSSALALGEPTDLTMSKPAAIISHTGTTSLAVSRAGVILAKEAYQLTGGSQFEQKR